MRVSRKLTVGSTAFTCDASSVGALWYDNSITNGMKACVKTASPSTYGWVAVGGNTQVAQVFQAYMSASWIHPSGWAKVPFDSISVNTLDGTFDATNNRFTASRAGYYQVSVTGYSPDHSVSSERYAIGCFRNSLCMGFTGGDYTAVDSPLAGLSMFVYLNGTTDYVEIWAFSVIAAQWRGGITGGHSMLWYINYLGG